MNTHDVHEIWAKIFYFTRLKLHGTDWLKKLSNKLAYEQFIYITPRDALC